MKEYGLVLFIYTSIYVFVFLFICLCMDIHIYICIYGYWSKFPIIRGPIFGFPL